MFIISRTYEFSAAHRIPGHPKCGRMHGHNYHVEVVLASYNLNKQGMVMDYGELDKIVKPIIEEYDHRYLATSIEDNAEYEALLMDSVDLLEEFSTAEIIAMIFFERIRRVTDLVKEVSIWETPKSRATYHR